MTLPQESPPPSAAGGKEGKGQGERFKYLVLPGNEPSLVTEAMERRSWWKATSDVAEMDFWWGGNGQRFPFDLLKRRKKALVFNKVEHHREVCTKTGLARTIEACSKGLGARVKWAPETFTFAKHESLQSELPKLARAFQRHQERAEKAAAAAAATGKVGEGPPAASGRVWILKPAAMNRGRGIHILDSIKSIESFLRSRVMRESYIVQKYIERPLLVEGRKFDIRMFVLVTSQPQRVYLHRDGYVRTCSAKYDSGNISDQSSHLTNDAVQKASEEYGAFEECNKMNFEQFEEAFRDRPLDFNKEVYGQIKGCTAELFRVAMAAMRPERRKGSFELFGLDFMIDEDMLVTLVEVNTSPALFRKGAHLTRLLPLVIEETIQKALDPHFPPPGAADEARTPPFDQLDGFEQLIP